MFQGIIFDLDGLMIDTETIYFEHFSKNLKTLGCTLTPSIFQGQMGSNKVDAAKHMIKSFDLKMSPEEMIALLGMKDIQANMIQGLVDLKPMPGLDNLINTFRNKLQYGIATGSSIAMVSYAVKALELSSKIPVVVSSEEVAHGKPEPDIYLEAARRMKLDPSKCIVLEDAPKGVMAGKAAGCFVIAVPSDWTRDFDFHQADMVCQSLTEAQHAINNLCHFN